MSVKHGLLASLSQGPCCGYELRSGFEARTGGAWPLTTDGQPLSGLLPPSLDIPWLLLLGLVAAVPAVAAVVAAGSTRGPLPHAGRKALG